jgi:DNA uptake protein and related DNA-binding proteins
MKWRERLSKKEASGVVTLIFTVLIIQAIIFLFNLPDKRVRIDSGGQQSVVREADSVKNLQLTDRNFGAQHSGTANVDSNLDKARVSGNGGNISASSKAIELFEFDPNIVTVDELVRLGLTEKQAATIINYRSKGGIFRKHEDLKKMYVISDEFYESIKEYIVISGTDSRNSIRNKRASEDGNENESENRSEHGSSGEKLTDRAVPEKSYPLLEINRADSLDLLDLPGIGPYYASRIVRYRNRIGGFISKDQLKEISGIDEERYLMFEARVYADTSFIYKADLNTVNIEELSSNPYIGSYLARAIVRFREQTDNINVKLLLENRILDRQRYELLKHYFL